jgi:hypothetical protein
MVIHPGVLFFLPKNKAFPLFIFGSKLNKIKMDQSLRRDKMFTVTALKKGVICFLTIMMLFMAGCYGTQTGTYRSDQAGPLRGGQTVPPGGNEVVPGPGGIGVMPAGSY